MADLTNIRDRIDSVDAEILKLFIDRMALTDEVAAYKQANDLPVLDRSRERAKLASVLDETPDELKDYATVLFNLLFEVSRANQSASITGQANLGASLKEALETTPDLFPRQAYVACQGVEGAFSQIAADKLFKHANLSFFSTFEGVFRAVEQGFCSYGVLPFENSSAGTVNQVYDLMSQYDFHIVRTVRLKIDHNLLVKEGVELDRITDVYSHQQAIDQCADFLASLEGVTVHMVENTAVAAKLVAESEDPALGSRSAAETYGLDICRHAVQDTANNYTRFACISKNLEIYPGADRSSLSVVVADKPGALQMILSEFTYAGINLTMLQSRPTKRQLGDYMFFVELAGSIHDIDVQTALECLRLKLRDVKVLGSYPIE